MAAPMCISDLCRSSTINSPPTSGIGVRVLPTSRVLVPKRDACAFLVQQEKPTTQPASHATVSYIAEKLVSLRFGCRSRYISRYVNLKLGFLPFVVASIVAMVFFSAVFAARAPAMGNSADRAWQLSRPVAGVSTAFNPSHSSLSYVQAGHCVSKQIGLPTVRFSLAGSSLLPGRRARRTRFPTCGVIRVAGYSVVWDYDPTPIFSLKSTKRSAAAILGRSSPSLLFMVRFRIFCCRQDFLLCFT